MIVERKLLLLKMNVLGYIISHYNVLQNKCMELTA